MTNLIVGEQWDWPNVWAPMQHILIVGLDNLEDERTKKYAQDWALRWVQGNYYAYQETEAMYEKVVETFWLLTESLIFFLNFSILRLN